MWSECTGTVCDVSDQKKIGVALDNSKGYWFIRYIVPKHLQVTEHCFKVGDTVASESFTEGKVFRIVQQEQQDIQYIVQYGEGGEDRKTMSPGELIQVKDNTNDSMQDKRKKLLRGDGQEMKTDAFTPRRVGRPRKRTKHRIYMPKKKQKKSSSHTPGMRRRGEDTNTQEVFTVSEEDEETDVETPSQEKKLESKDFITFRASMRRSDMSGE